MRIGKPLILILTPIGVIGGLYEGYRLAGGLVFIMFAMLSLISAAIGTVVYTARREAREEKEAARSRALAREAARENHAVPQEQKGMQ
jgi:hypothetical protein